MNKRKIKFLRAVRLLAPRDQLVLQFAESVDCGSLPERPGGAALELVAAFEEIRGRASCPRHGLGRTRPGLRSKPALPCPLHRRRGARRGRR